MDSYLRNFSVDSYETKVAKNSADCNQILNGGLLNTFNIYHNNIRSIGRNFDELKIVLEQINISFDCIVLTETWNVTDCSLFSLENYELIYNEGNVNQNDGVIVYVRNGLEYNFSVSALSNIKIVEVNVVVDKETVHITAVYRPPHTNVAQFNKDLYTFFEKKNRFNINVLIGDMNINILESTEFSQEYLNTLSEWGFVSAINRYTRCQGDSKTCLDHIFVQSALNKENFVPIVYETNISDHFSTVLQINVNTVNRENIVKKVLFREYMDGDKLLSLLSKETWNDVLAEKNVNLSTNCFVKTLQCYIAVCTTKVRVNRKEKKRNVWITDGLVKAVNKKYELHNKVIQNPQNIDYLNDYKRYRNKLNDLIKAAKTNYYKTMIHNNTNNSNEIWDCLKSLHHGKTKKSDLHYITIKEGVEVRDKADIAENFNEFFTNIGTKLAEKIPKNSGTKYKTRTLCNSIYISETDQNEIKKVIQTLKVGKSPGADGLRSETLKKVADYIANPLMYIINISIKDATVPDAFKTAIVKPLYKCGSKTDMSNYRPISLISNLAKIYEKILKERINSFLKKHNLLADNQYGFREAKSTSDALEDLTSGIYRALDSGKKALCVFVDLAKAFDTVSHSILLRSLENIGFRGTALALMRSYLSNRMQSVRVGDVTSQKRYVTCGVPQGTVLGPILFNIYVNNLYSLETCGKVISFADDTALLYTSCSWEEMKCVVEDDLPKLVTWFDDMLLSINFDKTCYIPFSCYDDTMPCYGSIGIGDKEIQAVNKHKYLGVIIDSNLRWNHHIDFTAKKLRSLIGRFKLYRSIFDIKTLRTLYFALVQPHLSYGIVAWGGVDSSHLNCLMVAQKWLLKVIYKKAVTCPSEDLYNECQVMDTRQLFFQSLAMNIFKNRSTLAFREHSYSTRTATAIIPQMKKTIGQRCSLYLRPIVYSELCSLYRQHCTIHTFKKKLRQYIFQNPRLRIHQIIDRKNIYYYKER